MHDSPAKSYYIITLQGERGPFNRADLHEAVQLGEVHVGDQVRNAFGRQLGTVEQVLNGPASDRAATAKTEPRVVAQSTERPWLIPAIIAVVVGLSCLGLATLRGAPEPSTQPPESPAQPPEPPAPPPAAAAQTAATAQTDVLARLPEAAGYVLVYDLNLLKLKRPVIYDVDTSAQQPDGFSRIAYLIELTPKSGDPRYVWAAMDAFASSARAIGLPAAGIPPPKDRQITHLQVRSNARGIADGDFPAGGLIEFWPCDYRTNRNKGITGGSDRSYDWNDTPSLERDGRAADGYGCMQVHLAPANLTLFAINHWCDGQKADLGIGNAPSGHHDWTMSANASAYTHGRLRILILPR
jgi:hypothetical protein